MTGMLCLSDPRSRREFFPAMANRLKLRFTQWPGFEQFCILLPAFRFRCANDRRMDSGQAKRESKRHRNLLFRELDLLFLVGGFRTQLWLLHRAVGRLRSAWRRHHPNSLAQGL